MQTHPRSTWIWVTKELAVQSGKYVQRPQYHIMDDFGNLHPLNLQKVQQ